MARSSTPPRIDIRGDARGTNRDETPGRFHDDRAADGRGDHRRPDRAAPAGGPVGARGGAADAVHQQPAPARHGAGQLRLDPSRPAAGRRRAEGADPERAPGLPHGLGRADPPLHRARNVYRRYRLPARRLRRRQLHGDRLPVSTCSCAPPAGAAASNYAGCHHDVEAPIDADNHGVLYLNSHVGYDDITDGPAYTILLGEATNRHDAGLGLGHARHAAQYRVTDQCAGSHGPRRPPAIRGPAAG